MAKMKEGDLKKALDGAREWTLVGEGIQRTFKFKDFVEAMRFVDAVAGVAEADQHHPDILVRWNLVTLTLTTHDDGGLSPKDFAMAKKVDRLVPKGA